MSDPANIVREGMWAVSVAGGPLLLALLVAGVVIGVLQAATQIQDPSVGFLPRLMVAALVCLLMGGWMMERLTGLFVTAVQRMAER